MTTSAVLNKPVLDNRALRAAVFGGLLGGAFDLSYAFIVSAFRGVWPERVLQAVASGWFGRPSFEGGWGTAAVGFVSHFAIVCVAALLYVIASRRIAFLNAQPIVSGAAFGAGIYFFMNYVVVPLSAAPLAKPHGPLMWLELLVHMFGVGVTIALFARRAS